MEESAAVKLKMPINVTSPAIDASTSPNPQEDRKLSYVSLDVVVPQEVQQGATDLGAASSLNSPAHPVTETPCQESETVDLGVCDSVTEDACEDVGVTVTDALPPLSTQEDVGMTVADAPPLSTQEDETVTGGSVDVVQEQEGVAIDVGAAIPLPLPDHPVSGEPCQESENIDQSNSVSVMDDASGKDASGLAVENLKGEAGAELSAASLDVDSGPVEEEGLLIPGRTGSSEGLDGSEAHDDKESIVPDPPSLSSDEQVLTLKPSVDHKESRDVEHDSRAAPDVTCDSVEVKFS